MPFSFWRENKEQKDGPKTYSDCHFMRAFTSSTSLFIGQTTEFMRSTKETGKKAKYSFQ